MTDESAKRRITRVLIEHDDGTTMEIDTPEQCDRWVKNVGAMAGLYATRGWTLPEVKWKTGEKNPFEGKPAAIVEVVIGTLAERIGVSVPTVRRWLSGEAVPHPALFCEHNWVLDGHNAGETVCSKCGRRQ